MTISQIRRLGDRLRHAAQPSLADLELLQQLRLEYDAPLQIVERTLRDELGMHATSRLKTVQTIIDKLVRERTRLSSMEDIAGARIVEEMTLEEQGKRVARIAAAFPSTKVRDRRATPSHGYRAMHVIVFIGDFPIEVQVRTRLQDLWAQSMEALAVRWGRQIQYGDPPARLEDSLPDLDDLGREGEAVNMLRQQAKTTDLFRSETVGLLRSLSEWIAELETTHDAARAAWVRQFLERFVGAFRRAV